MTSKRKSEFLLSLVVPIHKNQGIEPFYSWIQNISSFEEFCVLLCIDSDDEKLLEKINQLKSSNILIFKKKVNSPGLARNLAIGSIKSKFVMFVDSDDFVYLDTLRTVINRNLSSEVIVGGYEKFNSKSKILKQYPSPRDEVDLAVEPALWRIIFESTLVKDLLFTNHRMAEDQIFLIQALKTATHVTSVNTIIYRYFTNQSGQLSTEKNAQNELVSALQYLADNPDLTRTKIGQLIERKLKISLNKRNWIAARFLLLDPRANMKMLWRIIALRMRTSIVSGKTTVWNINE